MITERTSECSVCGSEHMKHYREYPTILWYDGHLELNVCKNCDNIFPAVRPVENDSIISNSVMFEARILYRETMVTEHSDYFYKRVADRLNEHMTRKIKVLWDAECGTGRMLKRIKHQLKSFGTTKNIYAYSLLRDADIEVYNGYPHNMILDGVIDPGSVDVVTMIGSLGHSYHVAGDIQAGYEALRGGGLLYISLYDFEEMKNSPLGGYLNYPRRHVLLSLFNSLHLEPVFVETIDNELHLIGRKDTK